MLFRSPVVDDNSTLVLRPGGTFEDLSPGDGALAWLGGRPVPSVRGFVESLRMAKRDPRITGVILQPSSFESPYWAKLQEMRDAVVDFRTSGKPLVAFLDADDLWLPHHLSRCVEVLSGNPDVDWVFAACRSVDADGHVVAETTFEDNGRPRRFLALQHRVSGRAHVIEDPHAIECHLLHGIYAGLQNSLIRASVFAADRFQPDSRVVDDTLFLLRAMKRGARLFGRVHLGGRDLKTDLLGQVLHSIHKPHARVFHQETDGISVGSTSKAVVELFGWADRE